MIPLAVIRPEPGCSATATAAQAAGMTAQAHPLFRIEPREWIAPDPAAYDCLLVGSANVFRHGGAGLEELRALPVLAVGGATSQAAREAGFTVAATGSGGLQKVLDAVESGTRLLRLAGEERIALAPPPGVTLNERVVYASRPLPMPESLAALLRHPCVVLLHSAEAARHLASECDRLAIARTPLRLAALGPRIARAAGEGWGEVAAAAQMDDAALLALAQHLCQTAPPKED